MTLTAGNDNDDIIEKFPNCAPLYKLWLLKFLKYHESNKPKFRAYCKNVVVVLPSNAALPWVRSGWRVHL
jgi:hypothetical protein